MRHPDGDGHTITSLLLSIVYYDDTINAAHISAEHSLPPRWFCACRRPCHSQLRARALQCVCVCVCGPFSREFVCADFAHTHTTPTQPAARTTQSRTSVWGGGAQICALHSCSLFLRRVDDGAQHVNANIYTSVCTTSRGASLVAVESVYDVVYTHT